MRLTSIRHMVLLVFSRRYRRLNRDLNKIYSPDAYAVFKTTSQLLAEGEAWERYGALDVAEACYQGAIEQA